MNATVSHEMRNPINSIMAQNMNMENLVKVMTIFVKANTRKLNPQLKKELTQFLNSM